MAATIHCHCLAFFEKPQTPPPAGSRALPVLNGARGPAKTQTTKCPEEPRSTSVPRVTGECRRHGHSTTELAVGDVACVAQSVLEKTPPAFHTLAHCV